MATTGTDRTAVVLGLGCDRNALTETLIDAVKQALDQAGVGLADVANVASIDLKSDERCIFELCQAQRWPVTFYTAQQLAVVPVPNPSETVRRHTGTPSVSEAAALLAAGRDGVPAPMHALRIEKYRFRGADGKNVTVSVALKP